MPLHKKTFYSGAYISYVHADNRSKASPLQQRSRVANSRARISTVRVSSVDAERHRLRCRCQAVMPGGKLEIHAHKKRHVHVRRLVSERTTAAEKLYRIVSSPEPSVEPPIGGTARSRTESLRATNCQVYKSWQFV